MKSLSFITFLLSSLTVSAQLTVKAQLTCNNKQITLPFQKDSFQLNTLKFYLTAPILSQADSLVWHNHNEAFLFDFSPENQIEQWQINAPDNLKFNKIQFTLGTDSIHNTSGVLEGALSPLNGMYWSWQSGYINIKIEGSYKKQAVVLHLGGYRSPYLNAKDIIFHSDKNELLLNIPFEKLCELLMYKQKIMSPSYNAVKLTGHFSQCINPNE